MSKKLTLLTTSLLSFSLLFAQKDTSKATQLDDIIVTANKIAQKQNTTGKVITVIDKEQIERSAGKTVSQVLNEQAGITINGALNNAGTNQSLYVRGADAGRTLILIDGIPVNDPSQITNGFDLNLFSINDIERIEICKGAQSTLYGSDAVAGVINIITIKNDINTPFNVKASISAGNKNTTRENLQIFGKDGRFTYTARFAKIKTDGFSAAYDSTGKSNFDKDAYDGTSTNGSLQYQANKNLSLKAFTQYSQYTTGTDAGPFEDERNDYTFSKEWISGTGFTFKKQAITIVGNYQYSKLNHSLNDNASIPGATDYSSGNYNGITQYAELYTNIALIKGFHLLAGGDYRYSSSNNQYTSQSSLYGPYSSAQPDTSVNQVSGYASLYYNSKHLNVELGGRYNKHSQYGTNYTYTFNPAYNFNEHYRIFGSIATGFKAPSLFQLYDPSEGNPNLKAEKSVNYEIGIQQHAKTISNRVVFFYRNIDNGIDFNYTGYLYYNYVSQIVRGIEYEVTVQPVSHLTITGNYTYLSGQQTTQNRITNQDTVTYHYLLRRPKHNINLTVGYQFTKALYAGISGKYVSSRYDIGDYGASDALLSSYVLLGTHIEYRYNNSVKFFADGQNLTNKRFFDVRGYNSIPFLFNTGVTFNL